MNRIASDILKLSWFDRFLDYWREPILQDLSRGERVRFGFYLFLAIYACNIFVDVISGVPFSLVGLLINGVAKSLVYMIGMVTSEIVITYYSKRRHPFSGVSIGKIWLISFLGYVIGYLLLSPYRKYFGHLEYHGTDSSLVFFIRISPVWIFLTYLYVQFHLRKSTRHEMARLRAVTQTLEAGSENLRDVAKDNAVAIDQTDSAENDTVISFSRDGLPVNVNISQITHVHVIEHYCTVSYLDSNVSYQIEVKSSLKEFSEKLPAHQFIQIHRSCLVSIDHITGVKKIPRSYEIQIRGTDTAFPVSRYRLSEVMPMLSQRYRQLATRDDKLKE